MRGVPPRAPLLKAPLLLLVWGLPHGVVAPRQEPKIPRSYTRIFRLDGALAEDTVTKLADQLLHLASTGFRGSTAQRRFIAQ